MENCTIHINYTALCSSWIDCIVPGAINPSHLFINVYNMPTAYYRKLKKTEFQNDCHSGEGPNTNALDLQLCVLHLNPSASHEKTDSTLSRHATCEGKYGC